jgi:hypothetical protein
MIVLAQRRHGISDSDLLARGALRLEPVTYDYVVLQSGVAIGSATSAIDTTTRGIRTRDVLRARALIAGDSQSITASSTAYLSRGFALDSFTVVVSADPGPLRVRGKPASRTGLLLPNIAPIALMLSRPPRVGTSTPFWLYNPVAKRVERVTLTIAAESLFRVVDSAAFDPARHLWVAAHVDTVRSWKIETPSKSIFAWVDSQGRVVAADEAGGASIVRTAYEIATLNPKLQTH